MKMGTRTRLAAITCMLLATEVGCGHSGAVTFPISGTVIYNGKSLPNGSVIFLPVSGPGAADAGAIHDGRFAFLARAGKKKVEIRATREVGEVDRTMGTRDKQSYIPAEYNSETTLTAEVVADGSNKFVFDLSGPP